MLPILYSFRRCPFAMRARLALDVSGQRCELREVALKRKPDEMLRASPKGTVPVLVDVDSRVVDESLDIMVWALKRNDPDNWLSPPSGSIDDMWSLTRHFDAHFKHHLDRYKYPTRYANVSATLSREAATGDLKTLDSRLQHARYLCGDRIALADMAIAPFVRQFANVDPGWFRAQPWPALLRWLDGIVGSERFERVMRPLDPWQPGSAGVEFPFR